VAGRGTGAPITLKCSTCKKESVTLSDGDWRAKPGTLYRTGRTRPRPTNNLLPRMTRTAHELWCPDCGNTMWSAHQDAERKPGVDTLSPLRYTQYLLSSNRKPIS